MKQDLKRIISRPRYRIGAVRLPIITIPMTLEMDCISFGNIMKLKLAKIAPGTKSDKN